MTASAPRDLGRLLPLQGEQTSKIHVPSGSAGGTGGAGVPAGGAGSAGRVPWIVGVTGASGTPYAAAVLRGLFDAGVPVDLVVSRAARLTLLDETGVSFRDAHWRDDLTKWLDREPGDVAYWPAGDLAAGPSSGSYPARGMLVVPASTAACAGIAIGLSKDLLQRAAEVNLKERRRVVVVPRETPVSRSHLEHLIALVDAGATVLPASPGFYGAGAGATAAQLVDFVAGKGLTAPPGADRAARG